MKSFISLVIPALAFIVVPGVTHAQSGTPNQSITTLLQNIITFSDSTLIPFILGLGFLFFVWGMFRYFIVGAADEGSRDKGKNVLIYAVVGFVAIIIFWGVINLLTSSSGFSGQTLQNIPTAITPSS
ncbi:hypothetical protein KC887_07115 [Candidatus Kaiserbacteria bacterium]|nr:hypothetical protein [Candidatus Kaiserbacteria bacterium]